MTVENISWKRVRLQFFVVLFLDCNLYKLDYNSQERVYPLLHNRPCDAFEISCI